MTDEGTLFRVSAPHFVAGGIAVDGVCVDAAPIIRWMVGKRTGWLVDYCRRKRWSIAPLPPQRQEIKEPE